MNACASNWRRHKVISIDEETFSNIVRSARFFIQKGVTSPGQAVSLDAVDAAVRKAVGQFLENPSPEEQEAYRSEAARQIQDGLRVQIADEKVLVDGPQVDWYVGDRKKSRPLWDRYRKYLTYELRLDDTTVASVDRASDRIVEQLSDPQTQNSFDRRGLVVGQVQSGKTTSYAALINKAIDAGYKVVVVLTGVHESLRVQTQKRMEESVRGLATETGKPGGPAKGAQLKLAQIQPVKNPPHLYTTRALGGDFSSGASLFASSVEGTHMFVVKKNVKILDQLARHFDSDAYRKVQKSGGALEIIERSLLIIDDEADNASVDVNKPDPTDRDHDPTAINSAIRRLLVKFRQRAYVGYTATPYANILIHKDNATEEEGRDLFPEDFIVMLPAPSNYVGPATFFGGSSSSSTGNGREVSPPLLRYVADCGSSGAETDWMPRGHKKHHVPKLDGAAGIPASLKDSVMTFVIATAVRHLRGWEKSHNSMLVHVSRFKQVQVLVREAVHTFVYELKGALADEAASPALVERFGHLHAADFAATEEKLDPRERGLIPSLADVKAKARDILDDLKVWTVNSEAETVLDYDGYPNGLNVICVGGDKLSRGLTLEGLTVSYFLRASRMYDTLMQMGRWFGYRPGYKDVCRLYLTKELARWYQHVTRADEELRGEFLTLQDERRRPAEFGLRVRSHPSLMVTAPAKMSSSEKFELKFGGRVSQTIHFFRDPVDLEHNSRVVAAFLGRIGTYADRQQAPVRRDPANGEESGKQPLPGYLYRSVSVDDVKSFIGKFRFHPEARSVSAPQLIEFLQKLKAEKVATEWSVLVASGGDVDDPQATKVEIAAGVTVVPVQRATKPSSEVKWQPDLVAEPVTLGVLASPTDLVSDLREREVARLASLPTGRLKVDPAEGEHAARSRVCKARDEDHCLLVIYVIEPVVVTPGKEGEKDVRTKIEFAPGSQLPIGLAVALPASEKMPPVSYVVNSVLIDDLERQFEVAEQQEAAQ